MTRRGILCAGAWCVDRNMQVNHWPEQETVSTILTSQDFGGCPGHNMSSALKRLGATFPVSAHGLVGDDAFGALLLKLCDELGIERSALEMRAGIATSLTYAITARDSGKRTFFHQSGALAIQTPDDFDFTNSTCRIAHLGLPGVHKILDAPWRGEASGWTAVLKKARAAGLQTNMELLTVEPEKIRAVATPFLPWLDMLIINDQEIGAIAGIQTMKNGKADLDACKTAAATVMERFPLALVAVHFPEGAVALARGGTVAECASVRVPQSEIIGSNGAGDCFTAGLLFGHHEGWPLAQSLKLAHASAAVSLRSAATTEAVLNWQDCLKQAEAWGWR